ncbi:Oxaloacetate decarboxylase, gamma chain [Malonomonas rubra DSM 5091]|uniref:Oxaloacetate decarboxylase, gamma chain n=1 Tax=Malonomonas rubra DSM 5091 TaxID=1122189 RepID=A0A1M6G7L5_MALRU|nr:OadG family protein [Malonomonas rubra]SHJ05916.1 Oxaloacetate decarboxylase, gamma chain [Malonomonas rubra DSM 5091]
MNFSWQNVIDGNGIGITLTGMLIVFSGLLLISLFITALPRVLALGEAKKQAPVQSKTAAADTGSTEPTEDEIMAVISLVLHLETERSLGEGSKLTISRQKRGSIWASAGKMRSLSEGGSHA